MEDINFLKVINGVMRKTILHIQDGKIVNKVAIKKLFTELNDGHYIASIVNHNNRSTQQNRYYFGSVIPAVKEGLKEIGYREITTTEQTHELMKFMFLKKQIVNENTGEVLETIGSTTKLSTTEFNEYIDRISQFAAEFLGVEIMPPSTQVPMFATYDSEINSIIIE
jgi:hypothetical protein